MRKSAEYFFPVKEKKQGRRVVCCSVIQSVVGSRAGIIVISGSCFGLSLVKLCCLVVLEERKANRVLRDDPVYEGGLLN